MKESRIPAMTHEKDPVLIVGAGIGGLVAAVHLAARGRRVTVFDAHSWAGGKIRTTPSSAGPVDAGPTVLTMRPVFEAVFAAAGTRLQDHLTLVELPVLARHFWTDGTRLDLTPCPSANATAIASAFGSRAEREFRAFQAQSMALFQAFKAPVMHAARPNAFAAARAALRHPQTLPWLVPGRTLQDMLTQRFASPHLRQLFGRYATYVGGNPLQAPAVLALIWQAEAAGVWAVQGGMARLAQGLGDLLHQLGGRVRLDMRVQSILSTGGRLDGVQMADGTVIRAAQVIFNGDPAALPALLGQARGSPKPKQVFPRSLSADVWTFAATVRGQGLGRAALNYHNVFFGADPAQEFGPLAQGNRPQHPTIYACAQDRATGQPDGPERFQLILNAPPVGADGQKGPPPCLTDPLARLARFGLHLTPEATTATLTQPQDFAALFPHSQGALYGLSPNGTMATFQRPTARSRLAGLYLAGGGVHPGAGVPMAALSGQHAAQAAMADRISAPVSRPTAITGGMSTG